MNDLGRAAAYVALFSEIGIVLLITVLVGTLAGYWIDQQLRTVPFFVLFGFAIGTTAGAVGCWRLMARFLARLDESDKRAREERRRDHLE
jgi:F0F1-type ATP synthase assembly protein I